MTDDAALASIYPIRERKIAVRSRNAFKWIGASVASLMLLSACNGAEGDEPEATVEAPEADEFGDEMQTLYDRATESGDTTIYAYGPPGAITETVAADFNRSFPEIDVQFEYLFGAELQARIAAEYRDRPDVDVFISGAIDNDAFREAGYLEEFHPESAADLPDDYREDYWASPIQVVMSPMYNVNLISEEDAPTVWADLISPDLAGTIGMSDPSVPATAAFMIGAALRNDVVDEDWVNQLGALNPKIFPSQTASVQAIASGQEALTVLVSYSNFRAAQDDGAPVEFALLEEGTFAWPQSVALAADSDAADAAKLFIAWLYTDAGQESVAAAGLQGTMPGAPRPEGLDDAAYFTYSHSDVLAEYESVSAVISEAF